MSTNRTTNRQLDYYIATSADGFIAEVDGGLSGFMMDAQYTSDYMKSLLNYDTVLMGKHTYEVGYQFGIEPGQPSPTYGHMMQYVFSQSMEPYHNERLQVIRDDPAQFVKTLKNSEGNRIYLCGGGRLAGYLLDHQLIDELILKVNPVVFGTGISLFAGFSGQIKLNLLDTKLYSDGNIITRYQIL